MEALFTIIGTILGFVLSEVATRIREGHNEKRQSASVRTILKLEMQLNLQVLKDFWPKVNQISDPERANQASNLEAEARDQKRKLARRFIEMPMPVFQKEALTSQMALLGAALNEQEAIPIFHFYDRFARLEVIRADLIDAMRDQQRAYQAATVSGEGSSPFRRMSYLPESPFDDKAAQAWEECDQLVAQILAAGNPLDTPA